jgi:hypothetical protein
MAPLFSAIARVNSDIQLLLSYDLIVPWKGRMLSYTYGTCVPCALSNIDHGVVKEGKNLGILCTESGGEKLTCLIQGDPGRKERGGLNRQILHALAYRCCLSPRSRVTFSIVNVKDYETKPERSRRTQVAISIHAK